MNVKDLKLIIGNLPDDMEVVMISDNKAIRPEMEKIKIYKSTKKRESEAYNLRQDRELRLGCIEKVEYISENEIDDKQFCFRHFDRCAAKTHLRDFDGKLYTKSIRDGYLEIKKALCIYPTEENIY
jgi:hypothetical protein